MQTPKFIFQATATEGRNRCTVANVGSAKGDPSAPKLTDGQRQPDIAIPEHLLAAPDRRCPNDPDLR